MIVEGELDCPRCGMQIDPDLDDWMMRDGESRSGAMGAARSSR